MKNNALPRLDEDSEWRERLLPYCRLSFGEVWEDPKGQHRVACIDATNRNQVDSMMGADRGALAIHDPPYNLVAFERRSVEEFCDWCRIWVELTRDSLKPDSALYVWLGADQKDHFQPLPNFMQMMSGISPFKSRSLITMRNQRGYGTQKNWMAVRQELLYYTMGNPDFSVQYTEIPKILRGYYKEVNGEVTENIQRSKSDNIRASNVWVDIQQVFYRMEENVSGCYAQKPLKSIERIIDASSREGNIVIDFFSHSGTTLLAAERLGRRCFTSEIDPLFCEISIRRLEHYRSTRRTGWQNSHAFEAELGSEKVGEDNVEATDSEAAAKQQNLLF